MFEQVEEYLQTLNEQQINDQLNEVFDQETSDVMVSNMKPETKIPSLWKVYAPGNDNMCIWLSNFQSKKDSFKQIKPGDKFAQLWFLSVSEKGNAEIFKGGLGSKPIAVLNAVFDTVLQTVMENQMNGVLLRFPIKKMKGKITQLAKISKRIVQQRSHGVYDFLDEIVEHQTGRYAFMLFYRKSRGITGIKEIGLNPEVFKVETSKTGIGEVVVNTKTGEELTKAEAIAQSVVMTANKQTEQQAAHKVPRIQKAELVAAFSRAVVPYGVKDKAEQFTNNEPDAVANATLTPRMVSLHGEKLEGLRKNLTPAAVKCLDKIVKKYDGVLPNNPKVLSEITSAYKAAGASTGNAGDLWRTIEALDDSITRTYMNLYEGKIGVDYEYYSAKENDAIRSYCGHQYSDMNNVFVANDDPGAVEHKINNLDKAFQSGVMIRPGTTLYRGMRVISSLMNTALTNKAFYFRNFVSTSYRPIIFTSSSYGKRELMAMQDLVSKDYSAETNSLTAKRTRIGFIIDPGEVPCIVPGGLSPYINECEVIMPRGTIFVFDAVALNDDRSLALIQCNAKHETHLEEGEIVYDGDALINEGVVKPMSFTGYINELTEAQSLDTAHKLTTNDMQTLLSIANMTNLPDKFMDVGLG